MQSILSRNSNPHRPPRKSSSFLSLKRETERSPTSQKNEISPTATAGPSSTSPTSYFEVYPRPSSNSLPRTAKSKSRASRAATSPQPSVPESVPRYNDAGPVYAFPSFDPAEDFSTNRRAAPLGHSNEYSRTRSRTGPSSARSRWEPPDSVPSLHFSRSSSTQHTETPPQTPDDYSTSNDSLDLFPVVVAAPIAGVETMDALVDGMNGGSDISSSSRRGSSRGSQFSIRGHHPLYEPPLPTPPPGVVLGGGKSRRKIIRKSSYSGDSSEDDNGYPSHSQSRRRRPRPQTSRSASSSTITSPSKPMTSHTATDGDMSHTSPRQHGKSSVILENRRSVVPSISEIIRNHAPIESQVRSRPPPTRSSSLYSPSTHGNATVHEEAEPEPEPEPIAREEDDAEFLSRSSIDSVADEVQRTIRNQSLAKPPPPPPPNSTSAFLKRTSVISDNTSLYSPRSDPGAPSIYSISAPSSYLPPSPQDSGSLMVKNPPSQAVAQYLRSARLTTLLKLTRSPHASADNPLTVSLSDLGSPTGFPIVVFLGLGCVRHIMGLYDEMASCLGLRLITIDRWGLGRTEPRLKSAKGIMQWACVVEEVLDLLHIEQCSIMAHSAGAPYALSFANKLPARVRGDICLLAPWVGGTESSGYKWLKYVPNSLLKTAQAAEWRIQAWMIGKPPTIAYEGIGYIAPPSSSKTKDDKSSPRTSGNLGSSSVYSNGDGKPRPSVGSNFSEYDDLRDFEGRFESRSTLGSKSRTSSRHPENESGASTTKRKTSRGFFDMLKGSPQSATSQSQDKQSSATKKLKGLRSMGSLKGKSQAPRASDPPSSSQLPPSLRIDIGLGLEDMSWIGTRRNSPDTISDGMVTATPSPYTSYPRRSGRRSISFTSSKAAMSMPNSPAPSSYNSSFVQHPSSNTSSASYQVALGNALIAASHAESAKGTHNDLLQILNHENHSWGFSYSSYPHRVRIWYGDKDERIAENAVRWMERTMGPDRCSVKVVKGADHGLMYRSSAVVDVFEWILSSWRPEDRAFSGLN